MKRKDDKALDVLAQAIDSAVKEHVKNASFDRTTEGIITNIFGNSKYEVLAFGSKYTVAVPQSVSFVLNEKVRVVVPQNNWSAMFIEKEDVVSSGGGSGGGHVIENYDGTVLPQRDILKFDGMEVTDDSVGRTVVHGLGVKVVDSVAPPNIPVYAILKPVGTAPSIPLYIYPDGETIVTDSNTGKISVKSAPKLTTPVKIGKTNFDGSADVSLAAMGAMPVDTGNYSITKEVDTGKIWIDGKKIYRKVIDFGALPNATTKSVAHNIENLDIFVNVSGLAYFGITNSQFIPLPYSSGQDIRNAISLYADPKNVIAVTGADRSKFASTYVILEYTKTTT